MPSGQAVPMITFLAQHIPSLSLLSTSSSAQAAFGEVLATCLASIRTEVVSAPSLARAVSDLITVSLSPLLVPPLSSLSQTAGSSAEHSMPVLNSKAQHAQHAQHAESSLNLQAQRAQQATAAGSLHSGDAASEQLLACLLRSYYGAVDLYGQCAASQMQIEPLPGQATGLASAKPSGTHHTGRLPAWYRKSCEVICHRLSAQVPVYLQHR